MRSKLSNVGVENLSNLMTWNLLSQLDRNGTMDSPHKEFKAPSPLIYILLAYMSAQVVRIHANTWRLWIIHVNKGNKGPEAGRSSALLVLKLKTTRVAESGYHKWTALYKWWYCTGMLRRPRQNWSKIQYLIIKSQSVETVTWFCSSSYYRHKASTWDFRPEEPA